MRPKRQSVIQHVLVLLVVLAVSHIASADDPCEESDDKVLKFASSLPRLSSDDLRQGKFDIKDAGAEFLIAYLIKGKQGFHGRISKFIDDNISPPSPEISQINVEGYSALFIKHVVGAGGRGICMYVVAPSPPANRFLVIPESGLYYQKHRGWSELLYWPYVNDRGRVERLDGLRDAQDIDCDGETELITREIQNWVIFDCNFADFEMPAWKRIYHLSPERQELYEVSAQFPKVYADLGDKLREDQNFRIGSSAEKSPRCETEVQRLIDVARKMASAGTGRKTSCTGDSVKINKLSPFLSFPLECGDKNCKFRYTNGAYTPNSINSVLDHNMDSPYKMDGIVLAFTGEEGKGTAQKQGCYPKVGGGEFSVKGLYRGTNDGCLPNQGLNYDNHPGYDYRAETGTPVKAAAGGKVVNVLNESTGKFGRCVPKGIKAGCDAWGYVGIDHENGYVTQYGHLSNIKVPKVPAGEIVRVRKGDEIGFSGQVSPFIKDKNGNLVYSVPPHLHFEVLKVKEDAPYGYTFVDPYGWEGSPKEDYLEINVSKIQNVRLWDYPVAALTTDPTRTTEPPPMPYVEKNKSTPAISKTISKAKEAPSAGCNKGSSVLSPSIGGAQGALKKFGTGTDGCAQ